MSWLHRFLQWIYPPNEEVSRKPELWRYWQAKMLLNGEHGLGEPAPVLWTNRDAVIRAVEREKGGLDCLTRYTLSAYPPDVALYRYRDHEQQWRYFFICREEAS